MFVVRVLLGNRRSVATHRSAAAGVAPVARPPSTRSGRKHHLYRYLQYAYTDALWAQLEADRITPMVAYLKAMEKKRFINALPEEDRPALV